MWGKIVLNFLTCGYPPKIHIESKSDHEPKTREEFYLVLFPKVKLLFQPIAQYRDVIRLLQHYESKKFLFSPPQKLTEKFMKRTTWPPTKI